MLAIKETQRSISDEHTRSLTCSFSVSSSCFSRICSSLKVGLRGLSILPGVPGVLRADLSGGEAGPFMLGLSVACCSTGSFEMYPNPTSDGFASCGVMFGGSANGDLVSFGPEMGELTEVASANLAVRGVLSEESEELELVLVDLEVTVGTFFSSLSTKPTPCGRREPFTMSTGETGLIA
jgi:hypothetical protein